MNFHSLLFVSKSSSLMFISHFFMPHPPVPAWFGGSGGGLLYASHVTSPHTAAAKRPLSPGPDGVSPPHTHTPRAQRTWGPPMGGGMESLRNTVDFLGETW